MSIAIVISLFLLLLHHLELCSLTTTDSIHCPLIPLYTSLSYPLSYPVCLERARMSLDPHSQSQYSSQCSSDCTHAADSSPHKKASPTTLESSSSTYDEEDYMFFVTLQPDDEPDTKEFAGIHAKSLLASKVMILDIHLSSFIFH